MIREYRIYNIQIIQNLFLLFQRYSKSTNLACQVFWPGRLKDVDVKSRLVRLDEFKLFNDGAFIDYD